MKEGNKRSKRYQRQEIGGRRAELGREIGVEGMEIFEVDEQELRVVEEAFSVGKDGLLGLEASNELLELLENGMVAGSSG
ncbi:hypothetical protein TIFTF001_038695 [Ficus carica]|uniref:Uncharacterized protein n=1 Tax=Ficus carica TaxID=3494 RepID=A0AA88JD67_FICCA|nr:hypothetical protein TIFTF001_038695 [Ficus carica]